MGATKYTEAQRVTVLGLYVENVNLPGIVTRTGLSRQAVASILGNMYRKSQRNCHAAPKPELTPIQPADGPTLPRPLECRQCSGVRSLRDSF